MRTLPTIETGPRFRPLALNLNGGVAAARPFLVAESAEPQGMATSRSAEAATDTNGERPRSGHTSAPQLGPLCELWDDVARAAPRCGRRPRTMHRSPLIACDSRKPLPHDIADLAAGLGASVRSFVVRFAAAARSAASQPVIKRWRSHPHRPDRAPNSVASEAATRSSLKPSAELSPSTPAKSDRPRFAHDASLSRLSAGR